MIRLLPRSPRGTWLLAGAIWLAAGAALWVVLPYRPRAAWPTEEPAVVHGFIPGTAVVLTSMPWSGTIDGPPGPMLGPLVARDAATGEVREWFPDGERLTLVDSGVDGKHVLVGRVIDGRARLFLHDAADGKIIAELPRGGPRAENENDQPRDAYEQFAAFRPDGRQVAYADRVDDRPWLRVWDVQTRREVAALSDAGPPAAWSPDMHVLAYTTRVGEADAWTPRLWDMTAGDTRALASPPRHLKPAQMRFSPDGRTVVGMLEWPVPWDGQGPPEIVGWDVLTGREGFRRKVLRHAFPDSVPWFFTDEPSGLTNVQIIHRCDYATGSELDPIILNGIALRISAETTFLGFSPDAALVLGVGSVGNSPLFELINTHILQGALELGGHQPFLSDARTGHVRYVFPMAVSYGFSSPTGHSWSSDGKLLAIAGSDRLFVWDIPPRKSRTWLALGAIVFALPPFVIARRRVRRLRRETAA